MKRARARRGETGWITETADLVQYISGPVEGSLADWPSHIQDQIAKQLELLNRGRAQQKLALYLVTGSRADIDPDTNSWFVHVIVQAMTFPPGGPINSAKQPGQA